MNCPNLIAWLGILSVFVYTIGTSQWHWIAECMLAAEFRIEWNSWIVGYARAAITYFKALRRCYYHSFRLNSYSQWRTIIGGFFFRATGTTRVHPRFQISTKDSCNWPRLGNSAIGVRIWVNTFCFVVPAPVYVKIWRSHSPNEALVINSRGLFSCQSVPSFRPIGDVVNYWFTDGTFRLIINQLFGIWIKSSICMLIEVSSNFYVFFTIIFEAIDALQILLQPSWSNA